MHAQRVEKTPYLPARDEFPQPRFRSPIDRSSPCRRIAKDPRISFDHSRQGQEQSALARAVRPDNRYDGIARDVQVHSQRTWTSPYPASRPRTRNSGSSIDPRPSQPTTARMSPAHRPEHAGPLRVRSASCGHHHHRRRPVLLALLPRTIVSIKAHYRNSATKRKLTDPFDRRRHAMCRRLFHPGLAAR